MDLFKPRPKVVIWNDAPPMEAGAPEPAVFADAGVLLVAYRTQEPPLDERESSVIGCQNPQVATGEAWAIIRFDSYIQLRYGYPNEEVLDGHPLYGAGLQYYEVQEIVNSPWAEELMRQNDVHPNNSKSLWQGYRHWLLAFHDETLEVLTYSEPNIFTEVAASAALAITAGMTRNVVK